MGWIKIINDFLNNCITSDNADIFIATLLIVGVIGLKTFEKHTSFKGDTLWSNFLSALIEAPMDLIILALGFTATYIVSQKNVNVGLLIFAVEIIVAIFIFGICFRATEKYYTRNKKAQDIFVLLILIIISYLIATIAYLISFSRLIGEI